MSEKRCCNNLFRNIILSKDLLKNYVYSMVDLFGIFIFGFLKFKYITTF